MKQECKAKVFKALSTLEPNEITKKYRYKDAEGLVCFNGMIAEVCSGITFPAMDDMDNPVIDPTNSIIDWLDSQIYDTKMSTYEYGEIDPSFDYDNDDEDEVISVARREIDRIHSEYCENQISFTEAKNKVKQVIEKYE